MTSVPRVTESETQVTEVQELVEDEDASLSRWERLKLLGWPKVGLLILGLVALTLGAINAWRAEESLVLLVVGLIFVLVGVVLAPDWSSIELAYGNFSAKLLRNLSGKLEQVEKEDDPAALRRELEELRTGLDASSKRLEKRRARSAPALSVPDDFFKRIFNPPTKATHSFRKDGAVELRLEWNSGGSEQVMCTIKPPEGEPIAITVNAAPRLPWFVLAQTFTIVYPNEVPGSAAPVPGLHEVRWDRVRAPAGDPVVEAMMPLVTPPIATDSFTLR